MVFPRERVPQSLKVLSLVVLSVLFFLFHIWLRTWTMSQGFDVGRHQKNIARLQAELVALRVKKNEIMGPRQLEKLVQDFQERGVAFSQPEYWQLIYLNSEK
jgi:hypothetical protein